MALSGIVAEALSEGVAGDIAGVIAGGKPEQAKHVDTPGRFRRQSPLNLVHYRGLQTQQQESALICHEMSRSAKMSDNFVKYIIIMHNLLFFVVAFFKYVIYPNEYCVKIFRSSSNTDH